MTHELKVDPQMWSRLLDGSKTFELRKDDRGYQAGDELILREFRSKDHECSDQSCRDNWRSPDRTLVRYRIGFVAKGRFYGLDLGDFAILSLVSS